MQCKVVLLATLDFYPRPPWGGRRVEFMPTFGNNEISIHALRGEGDVLPLLLLVWLALFLSTPSVGRATRHTAQTAGDGNDFYPRPPWGGRHVMAGIVDEPNSISIHALRGEGDRPGSRGTRRWDYFYPRPPWGGRRGSNCANGAAGGFLSTPSVGRATALRRCNGHRQSISIHALRGEGDRRTLPKNSAA